jgi:hypothetical protein
MGGKVILQYTLGFVLAALGVFLIYSNQNSSRISAQTAPDVVEDWRATKVLTIDTQGNVGNELGRSKRNFAIGPGEWTVSYSESGIEKYRETWTLPSMPNCYADAASCSPGGANASKFIWGLVCDTSVANCPARTWTFGLMNPDDAALFIRDNGRACGQGTISGKDDRNIHNISLMGAYGWVHGRYDVGGRGGFVWAGFLLPTEWRVSGDIL